MTHKYLLVLRTTRREASAAASTPSPAEMQAMYAAFGAWKEKFEANIVDMGGKLMSGGKVVSEGGLEDGPFIEAKEVIGGYMVVRADSYEQAAEIGRTCPGTMAPGCSIEIRQIAGG